VTQDWHGIEFNGYADSSLWRRKVFSLGARVNFFPRRKGRHDWLFHVHVILGFWVLALSVEPMSSHPGNYS
jgi:hypothetical protein